MTQGNDHYYSLFLFFVLNKHFVKEFIGTNETVVVGLWCISRTFVFFFSKDKEKENRKTFLFDIEVYTITLISLNITWKHIPVTLVFHVYSSYSYH